MALRDAVETSKISNFSFHLFKKQGARMSALRMFIPITKVDAAQRLVYGLATAELEDRAGEICDYASTKPLYEEMVRGDREIDWRQVSRQFTCNAWAGRRW